MTSQTATSLPSLLKHASVVYVIDRGNFTDLPVDRRYRVASTASEHNAILEELIALMRDRCQLAGLGAREFGRVALVVDDLSGFLNDTTPEQAHLDLIWNLGRAVNIQLFVVLLNSPDASQVSGTQRDALMGGFHHAVSKDSYGHFRVLSAWPEVAYPPLN